MAPTGGADPPAQTVTAYNPGTGIVGFTASLQGTGAGATGASAFQISPSAGVINSGQSQPFSVQASVSAAPAAVNTAKLTLAFSDGSSKTVNLLFVIAPGAVTSAFTSAFSSLDIPQGAAAAGCTASKLIPVFTLLGDNFTVPAAWPTPLGTVVVDDCGNPLNAGSVVASFSNGDPPLRLTSNLGGNWSGTWPPSAPRGNVTVVTVNATEAQSKLTGFAQISGNVNPNPAPTVSQGGVVETAAYSAPPAPGDLIAIFGTAMSTGTAQAGSVPLPQQLLTTSVILGGEVIPLYYTSSGQLAAVIPYDLATNTRFQLVVQQGNALSVPQSVSIGVTRPAVFTVGQNGQGQALVYDSGGTILADQNNPAKPGDTVVIYCAGLGAVTPPLTAGTATPLTFLTKTTDTLTATMGGQAAVVTFSGLTPGSTALYQVNAVVPAGLPDNNATTLVLHISGQDSATVTFAVHQ